MGAADILPAPHKSVCEQPSLTTTHLRLNVSFFILSRHPSPQMAIVAIAQASRGSRTCRHARLTALSHVSGALRARHCEHFLDRRVILVAAAGERTGASGVEAAIEQKPLVDMEADDLAKRQHGSAQHAAQRPDL